MAPGPPATRLVPGRGGAPRGMERRVHRRRSRVGMHVGHPRSLVLRAALIVPLLLAACTPGSSGQPSAAKQTEAVEAAKATVAPKPTQAPSSPVAAPAANGSPVGQGAGASPIG